MSRMTSGLRVFLFRRAIFLVVTLSSLGTAPMMAETPGEAAAQVRSPVAPCRSAALGSPYIPMDSWMYSSLTRLYSLGYLDIAFLGLRPWTRSSVIHMLEETAPELEDAPDDATTEQARTLYDALWHELNIDA